METENTIDIEKTEIEKLAREIKMEMECTTELVNLVNGVLTDTKKYNEVSAKKYIEQEIKFAGKKVSNGKRTTTTTISSSKGKLEMIDSSASENDEVDVNEATSESDSSENSDSNNAPSSSKKSNTNKGKTKTPKTKTPKATKTPKQKQDKSKTQKNAAPTKQPKPKPRDPEDIPEPVSTVPLNSKKNSKNTQPIPKKSKLHDDSSTGTTITSDLDLPDKMEIDYVTAIRQRIEGNAAKAETDGLRGVWVPRDVSEGILSTFEFYFLYHAQLFADPRWAKLIKKKKIDDPNLKNMKQAVDWVNIMLHVVISCIGDFTGNSNDPILRNAFKLMLDTHEAEGADVKALRNAKCDVSGQTKKNCDYYHVTCTKLEPDGTASVVAEKLLSAEWKDFLLNWLMISKPEKIMSQVITSSITNIMNANPTLYSGEKSDPRKNIALLFDDEKRHTKEALATFKTPLIHFFNFFAYGKTTDTKVKDERATNAKIYQSFLIEKYGKHWFTQYKNEI